MKKKVLFVSISALALFGASVALAGWLDPTQQPPSGNLAAPINIGSIGQAKSGGLQLNASGASPYGLIVNGNAPDATNPQGYGLVGIGTTLPAARLDVKGQGKTSSTYSFGVRNSANLYAIAVRDDLSVGIGLVQPTLRLQVSGSGTDGIAFFGPSATGRGVLIDSAGNLGVGVHKFPGTLPFGLVVTELGTNKDSQIRLQSDYASGPLNQIWFRKVDPATGQGPDWMLEQRFKNNDGDNIFVIKAADAPGGGEDLLTLTQGTNSGQAKVGIGTANPSSKLTVLGTIESTAGGFKFPDGTVQKTAAAPTTPKVDADEPLRIIRGSVSAPKWTGGQKILAGQGFTISDVQGLDKVTFANPFSGRPTITLESYFGDDCNVAYSGIYAPTKNVFYVNCGQNTVGYDFIVAGPQ